jgi:predicted dehydrogenase
VTEAPGDVIGYGLIGCGAFGLFCLEQYSGMRSVRASAVSDAEAKRARAAARKYKVKACSPDEILEREDVDLIHVATPPFTHADLVSRALRAGKHVLCEKPLATSVADAKKLVSAAGKAGRVLAVNLIMRYNPLCEAVKRIIDGRLLGEPLHAFFENCAKDEPLPPEHWFWDAEKSGGIFVEHGVHFFDLFAWWLGEGRVTSALEVRRPGAGFVDQVVCTALYGDVPVTFYHGFTQASRMDRQEMRLVFERGSVVLEEWVPTRARVEAICDARTLAKLRAPAPGPEPLAVEEYGTKERACSARHKKIKVDGRYTITLETGTDKTGLYGHVLRALLADQLHAVANPGSPRRVDETNGVSSLRMAEDARRLASARTD